MTSIEAKEPKIRTSSEACTFQEITLKLSIALVRAMRKLIILLPSLFAQLIFTSLFYIIRVN